MALYSATANVTSGLDTVTVVGLVLTPSIAQPGAQVVLDGVMYFLDEIVDTTTLKITRNYAGATASGVSLEINTISESETEIVTLNQRTADLLEELLDFDPLDNLESISGLEGNGVILQDATGQHSLVPKADLTNGIDVDARVETLVERDAYDGQPEGFSVLVNDSGDGRAAIYFKASNTSADWSTPAYLSGPVGPTPDVEATVAMLPPGSAAVVTEVPVVGGVRLDFELPEASGFYNAGVYNIANPYNQDDVVQFNGSSFIALQAVPAGEAPSGAFPPVNTVYWQVLAQKGTDGTGTGDVVGPSVAADGRFVLFDGPTGKIIKDSGLSVSDWSLGSKTEAEAFSPPSGLQTITLTGNNSPGDGGGGLHKPIGSPPILGFQDLNGAYWELQANEILPEQAGVVSGDASKAAANKIAFQKAADTGKIIKVPQKVYYTAPGIILTGGGIRGLSRSKSVIATEDTSSAHLFEVQTTDGIVITNTYFVATNLAKTVGSAIYLSSPSGANSYSQINGNIFAQFPIGVQSDKALAYTITDNVFSSYDVGVLVANNDHPDGGDSCITNNLFVTNRTSANKIGILQENSGGLKVIGNKINGGNYAYFLSATGSASMPTQSTSILIIQGNSFEHQTSSAISLQRSGSADSSIRFYHAIISGNMLNGNPTTGTATPNVISIAANLNLKWCTITGNTIQLSSTGGIGMSIASLDQGIISSNVIDTAGVSVGTGISTAANVYATVGPNRYGPGLAIQHAIASTTNTVLVAGG